MLKGALAENREVVVAPSLNKVLTSEGIVTALSVAGIHVGEAAVKGKSIPEGLKTFVYGYASPQNTTHAINGW